MLNCRKNIRGQDDHDKLVNLQKTSGVTSNADTKSGKTEHCRQMNITASALH
jgi:hypothetical protein